MLTKPVLISSSGTNRGVHKLSPKTKISERGAWEEWARGLSPPTNIFPSTWWRVSPPLPQLTPRSRSKKRSITLKSKTRVHRNWKMGLGQPAALLLAWEGYQCGACGAEFKTQAELRSHQVSHHSTELTHRIPLSAEDKQKWGWW